MSTFDANGLTIDTTDQILTKIEADELSTIDNALDTSPEEPLGQVNGVVASQVETALQLEQASYSAIDPNNAEGQQLDVVSAITGSKRKAASSTRVIATCSLDKGHVFTAATLDKNGNVSVVGQMQAQISGHPEFVFTMIGLHALGGTVFDTLGNIDTTTASGTLSYDLIFECTQTGAIACNAGTLTVISPAVGGWNSVTNAADAYSLGAAQETDAAFRIRRDTELVPAGGGTVDSMRESLLKVAGTGAGNQGVIDARVLYNDGPGTDGNGLPANSFACIIWDGSPTQAASNDIAQAIWNAKPAGIKAYDMGSGLSGTAKDSAGASHTVGFSRVSQLTTYINITVAVDSTFDTVNGPGAIAALLASYGNTLTSGQPVVPLDFTSQARVNIKGVRNVTVFQIDFHSSPTNTGELPVTAAQIARFNSANIAVTTMAFS